MCFYLLRGSITAATPLRRIFIDNLVGEISMLYTPHMKMDVRAY